MSEEVVKDTAFDEYIAKIQREEREQKAKDEQYRKEQYASIQKPFKMTDQIKRIMSK